MRDLKQFCGFEDPSSTWPEAAKLYEEIAGLIIANLDVPGLQSRERLQDSVESPRCGYVSIPSAPQESLLRAVKAVELSSFAAGLREYKLDGLYQDFLKTIGSNAHRIPAEEFHDLWLPFLQGLTCRLEWSSVDLTNPQYGDLWRNIFKAYINNYLGKQPAIQTSFIRPAVGCRCQDCVCVNRFLTSSQQVGRFRLNQQRRGHVHSMLDGNGTDCTHITERSGSPYTLVVTKTFKHNTKLRFDWEQREHSAQLRMLEFGQEMLKVLFGPDFSTLWNLEGLRCDDQGPPTQGSTSGTAKALLAVSGNVTASAPVSSLGPTAVKRKASEVIDLTGDD